MKLLRCSFFLSANLTVFVASGKELAFLSILVWPLRDVNDCFLRAIKGDNAAQRKGHVVSDSSFAKLNLCSYLVSAMNWLSDFG